MAKLEEVLSKCSVEELRIAADSNKLPILGKKEELISKLVNQIAPKKIFAGISNKQLQKVLGSYSLPRSGNKDDMIEKILMLIKSPKQEIIRQEKKLAVKMSATTEKESTSEKGRKFEEKVAQWVKTKFKAKQVRTNQYFKGSIAVRPFQIDVVVWTEYPEVVWLECKNVKRNIKRTDINKFIYSANDVKNGLPLFSGKSSGGNWDKLIFVSTSSYDTDAIRFAKANNIHCYCFDGRRFQIVD